jgi:hypothetical protein
MFARVVSKCVLLMKTLPGPQVAVDDAFACAPWWVGSTCGMPVRSCTAFSMRSHELEPA